MNSLSFRIYGLVFRQNFSIRSYEIGADRIASMESLMNHLQETTLNHVKNVGLLGDGFGSTPEMCKKNLIWVVTKMQVMVDRYPTWGDVLQVDTWVAPSGKNGMRRDWLLRDYNTGEILTRASRDVHQKWMDGGNYDMYGMKYGYVKPGDTIRIILDYLSCKHDGTRYHLFSSISPYIS